MAEGSAGSATPEHDRQDILKLHRDWWEANSGLDIPRMEACFPKGSDSYLMFNLNGHPYFGIDEKVTLWEWYQKEIEIPEIGDIRIMRFTIDGDLAWIASEGIFPLRPIGQAGTGSATWEIDESEVTRFGLRATEIYQRDDGQGNPVWKMWHFHCSPMPDEDEPRPAFGDTRRERGLGGSPWGEPQKVVGS